MEDVGDGQGSDIVDVGEYIGVDEDWLSAPLLQRFRLCTNGAAVMRNQQKEDGEIFHGQGEKERSPEARGNVVGLKIETDQGVATRYL